MITGREVSPGLHQPRSGIPSLELNSAPVTDNPRDSGVLGPRSGNRNRLLVMRKEPPTGRTTNRMSATKHARTIINRIAHRFRVARFILLPRRSLRVRHGH